MESSSLNINNMHVVLSVSNIMCTAIFCVHKTVSNNSLLQDDHTGLRYNITGFITVRYKINFILPLYLSWGALWGRQHSHSLSSSPLLLHPYWPHICGFYCNGYQCPRTILLYAGALGENRGICFLVVLQKIYIKY